MGIPIPGKDGLYIETGPRSLTVRSQEDSLTWRSTTGTMPIWFNYHPAELYNQNLIRLILWNSLINYRDNYSRFSIAETKSISYVNKTNMQYFSSRHLKSLLTSTFLTTGGTWCMGPWGLHLLQPSTLSTLNRQLRLSYGQDQGSSQYKDVVLPL